MNDVMLNSDSASNDEAAADDSAKQQQLLQRLLQQQPEDTATSDVTRQRAYATFPHPPCIFRPYSYVPHWAM